MNKANIDLDNISEEELLKLRIRDLPLKIEGTWLEECINKLYAELDSRGLIFRPVCYLADEWLAPDKEPVVGIPFYLAHPALIRLEKQMMLDVEGGTRAWCLKLLRHETGHALNYAFRLYKQKRWKELFGSFDLEYKDTYRFRAYSRSFVRHLEDYYAQYHPDEDFAETFAVWLNPEEDWQERYKGWRALQKLRFVDEMMGGLRGQEPLQKKGKKFWQASRLTSTLKNYYKKKRHAYAEDFHDFHDANLKKIFTEKNRENEKQPLAYKLIRGQRKIIINSVSQWTGEKKYIIDGLLKTLIQRCRELNLTVGSDPGQAMTGICTYITALMMNYMYTGRLRGKNAGKY